MPAPRGPRGAGAPQHRPAHHPARRTAGPTHGLTAAQARAFLRAAHGDGAYPVFVLAVVSGTRSAEIAAMRWDDVDLTTGRVAARASLVRVGGRLVRGPVKTAAGARGLPLVPLTRAALLAQRVKQGEQHVAAGADRQETGYVFTTRSGRPVEPRNLSRRRGGAPSRGRADIAVTSGIYGEVFDTEITSAVTRMTLDAANDLDPRAGHRRRTRLGACVVVNLCSRTPP